MSWSDTSKEEGSSSMTSTKPSRSISTMPWWAGVHSAFWHHSEDSFVAVVVLVAMIHTYNLIGQLSACSYRSVSVQLY